MECSSIRLDDLFAFTFDASVVSESIYFFRRQFFVWDTLRLLHRPIYRSIDPIVKTSYSLLVGKHLYFIQSSRTGAVKIGRSDDPEKRLLQLQTGSPYPLRLILVAREQGPQEKRLHKLLIRYQTQGEWFKEISLGSVPVDIWEQTLPWYRENPDWWKSQ